MFTGMWVFVIQEEALGSGETILLGGKVRKEEEEGVNGGFDAGGDAAVGSLGSNKVGCLGNGGKSGIEEGSGMVEIEFGLILWDCLSGSKFDPRCIKDRSWDWFAVHSNFRPM